MLKPRKVACGVCFVLGLLAACSDEATLVRPENARSLLAGSPTTVLETARTLRPTVGGGWGSAAASGWSNNVEPGGAQLGVRNRLARAALWIAATRPVAREVRVAAWTLAGRGRFEVELNGVALGTVAFEEEERAFAFEAPALLWLRGRNELAVRALDPGFQDAETWAVGAVEVTPPARYDAAKQALAPGVEVAWDVLTTSAGLLDLEAHTRGSTGRLVVRVERKLPDEQAQAAHIVRAEVVADEAGVLRYRCPLPLSNRTPLRVSLRWSAADPGQALSLDRVVLMEDAPAERPPVLFISIDTLAAQNMSVYGYARPTTPNLEAFQADSVTFTNARANAPWTVPSYASQFTGLFASSSRIPEEQRAAEGIPFGPREYRIGPERQTLAELFAARGYRTAAFVDNLWLLEVSGLRQGFEVFDGAAARVDVEDHSMGAEYVFKEALDFLSADADRPPFVFAHAFDVHGPYHPQAPFAGTFSNGVDVDASPQLSTSPSNKALFGEIPEYIAKRRWPDLPELVPSALLRADYDEKVLEMDARIGELFDELRAAGLYDELLIVVSADHGESMEDHHYYFRHGLVYESAIHVPLMVKLPDQEHGGVRVSDPVQLVDLLPTFAEALGLAPAGAAHGTSLMPLMRAEDAAPRSLLSEANLFEHTALIDGGWKLIEWRPTGAAIGGILSTPAVQELLYAQDPNAFEALVGQAPLATGDAIAQAYKDLNADNLGTFSVLMKLVRDTEALYELYDLERDPFEQRDVSAAHPDRVAALKALMDSALEEAHAERRLVQGAAMELSAATKAKLEALGYVTD